MVEIFVCLTYNQGGMKVGNAMLQQMLEIFSHFRHGMKMGNVIWIELSCFALICWLHDQLYAPLHNNRWQGLISLILIEFMKSSSQLMILRSAGRNSGTPQSVNMIYSDLDQYYKIENQ